MVNSSRLTAGLLVLVLVLAACHDQEVLIGADGSTEADTDHSEHEHWATDSLDTRDAMAAAFADGRHQFAPENYSFQQVGLVIDGQLSDGLQYRVQTADGTWSQERPLEITWSEGDYHVGRILLEEQADKVELVGGQGIDRLFLEFYRELTANPDVVTRDLPLESEVYGDSSDGDVGTVRQAVAPASLVISRAQWGARHPNKICGASHNPSRMSIHHTAQPSTDGPDPAARMRQMQAFHIDSRNWCDLGYHFVVSQSGNIYQGRSSARRTGAHVGGHNTNNVGISLIGNFQNQVPGNAQLDATVDIMRWVHQTFSIPLTSDRTRGHQQWPGQSTSCPGTHVLSRLGELRQRAAQPANQPAPPPEEEDTSNADVSFISPVDGATIPNPAIFEIEATGGVATVQIKVDDWPLTQPFDPSVTNPFTYDFVGTGFQRKVVLEGYSAAGSLVASQTIHITVADGAVAPQPPPVQPRVAFTSPGDGDTIPNPVTFGIDAEGVHRVQIKADGWPLSDPFDPSAANPFTYYFVGTGFQREVVLEGYSAAGSLVASQTIHITVTDGSGAPDPVQPRVAFTSPGDGAAIPNPVTFHFDAEGVHRVQIKADDWPLADEPWDPSTSTSHSFSFMGTGFAREVVLEGYAADGSVLTRDTIEIVVQD